MSTTITDGTTSLHRITPSSRARGTTSRRAIAAIVAALAPLTALGQAPVPADSLEARIDAIFAPYTAAGSPGCLVGLDRAGHAPFMKGYGLANLEYGVPLTANSISESGSVAKQFTAAAVALLHLEGKLSLDDDIRKWIPELPDFGQRLTLRRLLSHTSGLRDQWALLFLMAREPGREVHTNTKILDLVSRQRELNFPTGTAYLYSNSGYVLAAIAVERATGMPFARFTQDRFFVPLGMTNTQWRDDYRRVVPDRATAYSREGNAWMQDMPFTKVHGNGGLLSSLSDLLRWNRALDDGLLGRPELTRLLETPTRLVTGREITYALGLTVEPWRDGVREVSHGGATAGYRTFLARYPEARTSVAVWCNVAQANAGALAHRVIELVLPRPNTARGTPSPIAAATRAAIEGSYRDPNNDDLVTLAQAGEFVRVTRPVNYTLHDDGNGSYSTPSGIRLTFLPAGAKAQRLRLDVPSEPTRELVAVPPLDTARIRRADFVGRYRSPELESAIVIHESNGRLAARISPDDDHELVPYYVDGFRAKSAPITLRFVRNASGRVTGLQAFAGRALHVRFDRVAGR